MKNLYIVSETKETNMDKEVYMTSSIDMSQIEFDEHCRQILENLSNIKLLNNESRLDILIEILKLNGFELYDDENLRYYNFYSGDYISY